MSVRKTLLSPKNWWFQALKRSAPYVPHPTPDFLHFDFDHGLFVRFQSCGAVGSHGSTWISWVTWWRIWRLQRLVAKAGEDQAPRSLDWYCRQSYHCVREPSNSLEISLKNMTASLEKGKVKDFESERNFTRSGCEYAKVIKCCRVIRVSRWKWQNMFVRHCSGLSGLCAVICHCYLRFGFGFEVGIEICKVFASWVWLYWIHSRTKVWRIWSSVIWKNVCLIDHFCFSMMNLFGHLLPLRGWWSIFGRFESDIGMVAKVPSFRSHAYRWLLRLKGNSEIFFSQVCEISPS